MSRAMERRLPEVRQQNPEADYATIAGDFDPLLDALIDAETLQAFADKYGFTLSKRLVDARDREHSRRQGLNGKFSEQAYPAFLAQQRMTDQEVRDDHRQRIAPALLLTPSRPTRASRSAWRRLMRRCCSKRARAKSRSSRSSLPRRAQADRRRPPAILCRQPRALHGARAARAAHRPDRPRAGRRSPAASDQEIAAYYNANQATYGAKETRIMSQAVVPDQATANAIAGARRGGRASPPRLLRPASAPPTSRVGAQTREQFASLAGDAVAGAAFAAPAGAIVGPIQSDFGWHVVKVDRSSAKAARPLAAARAEIAAKLTADKRKEALEDLVDKVQDAIDDGSNFTEAAAPAKLAGHRDAADHRPTARRAANPGFKLPPELAPALKTGFEIAPNDEPRGRDAAQRRRLCAGRAGAGRCRRPGPAGQHPRAGRRRTGSTSRRSQRAKAARARRSRPRPRGCRWPRRLEAAGPAARGSAGDRAPDPDQPAAATRFLRRCDAVQPRPGQEPDGRRRPRARLLVVKVNGSCPATR